MGIAREWNLNWQTRLGIACCAVVYVLLARPWDEPTISRAFGSCGGALSFLILALLPRRTRFWTAVGAAIIVPIAVGIIVNLYLQP